MKKKIPASVIIGILIAVVLVQVFWIGNIMEKNRSLADGTAFSEIRKVTFDAISTTVPTTAPTTAPTQAPTSSQSDSSQNKKPEDNDATTKPSKKSDKPETKKEIINKYTELVDAFKKEKPAYKKKEFQHLPEEHRNFSSVINSILSIAARYMVSEEEAEVLIRDKGAEEILYDMPIHGTEKGCALTDYDAVEWAKCEDLGDGTYKLSFSLKEEVNAEPTPADTLVPVSAHGAVMQPVAFKDIKAEVDKVASTLPGVDVNEFSLYYRNCDFSCIYNPKTNEVLSITHYIIIDIAADAKFLGAEIIGTARLVNEMYIYDITW